MSLSYSKLQLYRRCPRQYEFACIKKIPRPISAGESFGSSVHNTLKKWGEREGIEKPQTDQLQIFEEQEPEKQYALSVESLQELWHQSFIVEGYESRVEADAARQKGEKLMQHFFAWWESEQRTVLAVEKGFSITIEGTKLTGRFDRIERTEDGVHVIDFKTGKPQTQEQVDADLQLSIYALATQEMLNEPCAKLTLLYLYEEELIERTTERSASQLDDAKKQILSLEGRIAEGDMHPTPSKDVCKCCPYKGICDVSAV